MRTMNLSSVKNVEIFSNVMPTYYVIMTVYIRQNARVRQYGSNFRSPFCAYTMLKKSSYTCIIKHVKYIILHA